MIAQYDVNEKYTEIKSRQKFNPGIVLQIYKKFTIRTYDITIKIYKIIVKLGEKHLNFWA